MNGQMTVRNYLQLGKHLVDPSVPGVSVTGGGQEPELSVPTTVLPCSGFEKESSSL